MPAVCTARQRRHASQRKSAKPSLSMTLMPSALPTGTKSPRCTRRIAPPSVASKNLRSPLVIEPYQGLVAPRARCGPWQSAGLLERAGRKPTAPSTLHTVRHGPWERNRRWRYWSSPASGRWPWLSRDQSWPPRYVRHFRHSTLSANWMAAAGHPG